MTVLLAAAVVVALSAVALWRHGARNVYAQVTAPTKGVRHRPRPKRHVTWRSGNHVAFTDTTPHPKEIAA